MESGERGMDPVAMTIINPRKDYWSNRRFEPATSCSQVFQATDWAIWGLGFISLQMQLQSNGFCRELILYQKINP